MKKITILLSFLSLFFFVTPPSYGQSPPLDSSELLRLSPVIFTPTLNPGTRTEYVLTIENLTDQGYPATLTFEGFDTTSELGGYTFNNAPSLLSRWMEIPEKEILLPAQSKKEVRFYLNISSRVPLGGYYGVIFVNPILTQNPENIVLAPKVGALLLANIGVPEDQKDKITILDFSPEFFSENGISNYTLRIQNRSLFHYTAKPILNIYPLFGKEQKIFGEEKFIFPGKIRRWEESITLSKTPNIYKTVMNISVGDGQQIQKTAYIIVFPVKTVLMIIIVIIVALFLIFQHKRVNKALRILLTGKGEVKSKNRS